MNTLTNTRNNYIKTLAFGIIILMLAASIITYPDEAFKASLKGLKIWWEIIFPSLLPFLITSEILLGLGIVHFLGVLLEPLMKPLFNVKGVGAFVLAMGFASGYPMGAKLTSRLREQNLITKTEGERLVSFTSTSDPLFLFGAVAVGFFNDARLGALIAIIHYSSSIVIGFIMRYYKINKDREHNATMTEKNLDGNIIIKAFQAMHEARIKDGRKFGTLMGDAVMSSIETLQMIGGFIMIFSVVLTILTKLQITLLMSILISKILMILGISTDLSNSIIYGLFEVTLGAKSASEAASSIPMVQKIAIVSAVSAWSGISVHAQIAAILQKTDIKYMPFLFARIIHVIIAFLFAGILWNYLNLEYLSGSLPVFLFQTPAHPPFSIWLTYTYIISYSIIFLSIMLLLAMLMYFYRKRLN
ncbi:sporulation integral membrane protein YlbJ [Vulcanibacillus modesticaldus]|uniref:Sporulation integral membrane protein YlbJ n=1 Tax=Vulcanibacillus modesticaldus TaxID=337097 RepID=A0A1D2YX89_9BACI|nr:sporulation integral membrane protein YlbJ [Vulcanibacillus modesticaldus]OEG00349.1 sporulation integral membrane protein YlbJ [Vulcanibacillus modesticaldus]